MQQRVLFHIAFWVTYVLFKAYLNFETGSSSNEGESKSMIFLLALAAQGFYLLVKIPLIYTLFYVIDNFLMKNWSVLRSGIIILVSFFLSVTGYILINHFIIYNWMYGMNLKFDKNLIAGSIIYSFFILCFTSGIAIAIKLIRSSIKQKLEAQELTKNKLEAELNLLRSQINPHFLFNTLNNIYALATKRSEQTAPIVMKLSKLLRFMLYESNKERILISQEIKLLEDYIELEKIRYNESLSINVTVEVSTPTITITPLLILPLVENAFKHGAGESTRAAFINIEIKEINNVLTVVIKNSKETEELQNEKEGIGLKNVRRQLELTYNDFDLEIKNETNSFVVKLTIDLESYEKI